MQRQGRPHRANQFRQLQFDADCRDAEGGNDHHAERRFLGRRRRADHLRRSAGRAQRLFRGNGKAHPLGAAARSESFVRLKPCAAALLAAAQYRMVLMDARRLMTRRDVVGGAAASAASLVLPCPAHAQSAARIVVIGGGFGGASCARALKRVDPGFEGTLIEPNRTFIACPFSNQVVAGLREIEAEQFNYDRIGGEGVTVIAQAAAKVDAQKRMVDLADGTSLGYERLVLAPGIDIRYEALPGYDEAAAIKMPHAWKAGEQTELLRKQLEAMDDGGLVALAVPAAPSRCPPAPYERASLIAHYLKSRKPRSKLLILDAQDAFPQQRLFENAWKELYAGMIDRVSLSQGGRVTSVDPASNTFVTDFGNYTAQVANVIPPQQAGRIAAIAGAVDNTGWWPTGPVTSSSKLVADTHVIGDACLGGGIPKSASAANAQGK